MTTQPARPLVVAHRGAPTVAPEHTIPAYEAALQAGADALELDVHLSADDQLVVIHDGTLAPRGVLNALCLPAALTLAADVAAVRETGLECHVWGVDDPLDAQRFVEWGVAGLVTDRPDLVCPVVARA